VNGPMAFQGLLVHEFDGGGEKVGIDGIVVGMVGNGVAAGRGGRVTLGTVGKVG